MRLGHRGAHRDVPENTLAAFAAAAAEGLDGVETDVRVTRDGELVLFHDRAVAGGPAVVDATRAELSRAAGFEVPTLEAALRDFPRLFFDLEVKAPEAARPALDLVQRVRAAGRVVVTSFRHDLIADLSGSTAVPLGLILSHRPADLDPGFLRVWRGRPGVRTLAIDYGVVDGELVRAVRAGGFDVFLWGFESAAEAETAAAWSPTAIIL